MSLDVGKFNAEIATKVTAAYRRQEQKDPLNGELLGQSDDIVETIRAALRDRSILGLQERMQILMRVVTAAQIKYRELLERGRDEFKEVSSGEAVSMFGRELLKSLEPDIRALGEE